MAKYCKKPVVVEVKPFGEFEAITFEEFIDYGKNNGANIVNGMPWSFNYKGHQVTHENDQCYLITSISGIHKFTPEDILVASDSGDVYPCNKNIFEATYEKAED